MPKDSEIPLRSQQGSDGKNTSVASLSETLGARDPATRDPSRRVAELASGFARFLDLSQEKIRQISEMVEKHCPVMDTQMRAVEVNGKVRPDVPAEPPHVVLSEIPAD
jgi:hypothetical protein